MIKSKAKIAVLWSMFSTFGGMIVQVVYGLIMARLLTPEDFGLMAIALIVVTISKSIVDSGFYQALIQQKDTTKNDLSAVFKFNLILATVISFFVWLGSEAFADFFGSKELDLIFQFFSILIIIESLSLIQRATLVKEIKFELIAKIELGTLLISSVVGILLALQDFGIYSLVYKTILQVILATSLFWICHPLSINFSAPLSKLGTLFNFGFKVFVADQIEVISNQLAFGIIGKRFAPIHLGYFSKAVQYQNLLSQTAIVSINKVVFPSFAKIQNDDEQLRRGYKSLMKLSTFLLIPLMLIAFVLAEEIIFLLLGTQWEQTIPYFKILCLGGIFYPFTVFNLNIIKVKGFGSLYLKVCLLSKGLLLPAILVGMNFGINGIAYAIISQQMSAAVINSYFSGRLIGYSLIMQIKDIAPYIISAILPFVISLSIYSTLVVGETNYLYGVTIGFIFLTVYILSLYIFPKKELAFLYSIVFQK